MPRGGFWVSGLLLCRELEGIIMKLIFILFYFIFSFGFGGFGEMGCIKLEG
jgi:hypothetical protein